VIRVLMQNVDCAKATVRELCSFRRICRTCIGSLASAILTAKDAIPADAKKRLELLIGPYV
jgi:hypothetical protein